MHRFLEASGCSGRGKPRPYKGIGVLGFAEGADVDFA